MTASIHDSQAETLAEDFAVLLDQADEIMLDQAEQLESIRAFDPPPPTEADEISHDPTRQIVVQRPIIITDPKGRILLTGSATPEGGTASITDDRVTRREAARLALALLEFLDLSDPTNHFGRLDSVAVAKIHLAEVASGDMPF